MFKLFTGLFCPSCMPFGTGPKCEDCEDFEHIGVSRQLGMWAKKNSKHTSAEEIIVAAIVQSFAVDFDKWEDSRFTEPEAAYNYGRVGYGTLTHPAKNIIIKRQAQKKYNPSGPDKYRFHGSFLVNDIEIPSHLAALIVKHWEKVAVRVRKANEVADEVKANQDKLNRAWNLAETLLGMERNEQGALVPKETAK